MISYAGRTRGQLLLAANFILLLLKFLILYDAQKANILQSPLWSCGKCWWRRRYLMDGIRRSREESYMVEQEERVKLLWWKLIGGGQCEVEDRWGLLIPSERPKRERLSSPVVVSLALLSKSLTFLSWWLVMVATVYHEQIDGFFSLSKSQTRKLADLRMLFSLKQPKSYR